MSDQRIEDLLAQIERLATEREAAIEIQRNASVTLDELRAENERLTAALQLSQSQNYCTLCGSALENKPDYREPNYRDDPRPSEVIAKDGWPDESK